MHPAIHELKKQIQNRYGGRLARFLIHGSYARGEHAPDSDIDVMVTLKGNMNWKTKHDIWDIALGINIRHDVVFDVQVFSEDDIQNTIIGASPFVETVMEEGISV